MGRTPAKMFVNAGEFAWQTQESLLEYDIPRASPAKCLVLHAMAVRLGVSFVICAAIIKPQETYRG